MKNLQITKLHKSFDRLQNKYGDKNLNAIYGAGNIKSPKIFFVFMNPTGRNISSDKNWRGLRAPWVGTKNIWKVFHLAGLFDKKLYEKIQNKRIGGWDIDFVNEVYKQVFDKDIYITNLSKATQIDARPLKNSDFFEYIDLIKKEINFVKPKIVITFGNQVSSILLGQKIEVSKNRRKCFGLTIGDTEYDVFPVHYPVGQGMRNIGMAITDVRWLYYRK